MRASVAELIHALPPVCMPCHNKFGFDVNLIDWVVLHVDQEDEATFREESQGRKVEAKIEGYGSQYPRSCVVDSPLVNFKPYYVRVMVQIIFLARRCVASCTAHLEKLTSDEDLVRNIGIYSI